MFLHSPVLDTIVFVMCLLLFRELVVGNETANEDARLLMKHSKLRVRFGLWIILFLGVSYITLSDFLVLDGRYYNECVYTLLVMLYLIGVYGNYVCYKHGPKNESYKQRNLLQLEAIILLPVLFLLMYFF